MIRLQRSQPEVMISGTMNIKDKFDAAGGIRRYTLYPSNFEKTKQNKNNTHILAADSVLSLLHYYYHFYYIHPQSTILSSQHNTN